MSYQLIRPAIYAVLQTIPTIQEIHKHHRSDFQGYPAVTFEPTRHANEMYTNRDNLRQYDFDIIAIQEYGTITLDEAFDILCKLSDDIIETFDNVQNLTLGGACHYTKALPGTWGHTQIGSSNVIYHIMPLTAAIEKFVG